MAPTEPDPRFDPRYQRGYDATRHRHLLEEVTSLPAVVAPAPVATFVAESTADEADLESDLDWDEPADGATRRRNPYFIALFVFPALLLAASAYLLFSYAEKMKSMFSVQSQDEYLVYTMVPMIVPALIVTAFASLILAFTQLALAGRRRG